MFGPGRDLFDRAREQVRSDLRTDPYLLYILLSALFLAGFWFWHRIPNFATRDEKSRLLDAMVPYGRIIDDPSLESLRNGIEWSRAPFGATLYLFGLAILPVVAVAVLTGQSDIFASMGYPDPEFGFYTVWADTPRWVWTWSLGLIRLTNVAFAVGCVYLTYRLGTAMTNRWAGRVAAVTLTLTFGFLTIAHEGGEDMPALFFVLLALTLLYTYIQTGERTLFLLGSVCGGVAIAFKLTAAPIIIAVGAAHLLRAITTDESTLDTLLAPRLVLAGAALGAVMILIGFPTFLAAGFDPIIERMFGGSMSRMDWPTGPTAPVTWWFLRGYFSALGLPLVIGVVAGIIGAVVSLRRGLTRQHGTVLVLLTLVLYLGMFSQWHDFRVHHLLPTFPLLAILLAQSADRLHTRNRLFARALLALLFITTGIYAGTGTAEFASMPRDNAEAWLVEHSDEGDTMEVYRRDFHDAAVPHGMNINHARGAEPDEIEPCPEYIQLGYRDLLYLKPDTYYRNGAPQAEYIRDLLNGTYSYRLTAEFGQRPPDFVPQRARPGVYTDLLRYGLIAQTDQFADEQELSANQYTAILERTGECTGDRPNPF
jgi:hypothetical protein